MFTIITEQYEKMLRRDYRLRLASVVLFALSIICVVGIVSLIPSYILSNDQYTSADRDLQALRTRREESGVVKQEKEIFVSRDLINKVNAHVSPVYLSGIVEALVAERSSGISITQMTVDMGAVSFGGVARDRESLVAFKRNLEQSGRFIKVELPLSDLAKSRNINFSIKASITAISI